MQSRTKHICSICKKSGYLAKMKVNPLNQKLIHNRCCKGRYSILLSDKDNYMIKCLYIKFSGEIAKQAKELVNIYLKK